MLCVYDFQISHIWATDAVPCQLNVMHMQCCKIDSRLLQAEVWRWHRRSFTLISRNKCFKPCRTPYQRQRGIPAVTRNASDRSSGDGDGLSFGDDVPGHKAGFVAIIGKPNAGKSTMLNALLGQQLSIVTHKAQTTRHKILGILSEEGYQIVFLDTPGVIQDKRNKLEERMMRSVQDSVKDADALLAIIDASLHPEEDLGMVLNKVDLLSPERLSQLEAWFRDSSKAEGCVSVSALNGTNTAAVVDWVLGKLPEGPSMYPKDFVAEAPERFFISEIIRRQVFLNYQQEIPYSVAVEVVGYKERKGGAKDFVDAHILVEHDRQRGILLGKGGAAIKRVSTASRQEIEEFVGRPVYLQLSVKVAEGWRKDPKMLEKLGY